MFNTWRMGLEFAKWQGTGNDFILIDDRDGAFNSGDLDLVRFLCDRHLGVGSDGLILIQRPVGPSSDFHMEFFNPDGSKSFCGNGSRCAFAFWCQLKSDRKEARFTAIDGEHVGAWRGDEVAVSLAFEGSVTCGTDGPDVDFVNTGSPHELVWVEDPKTIVIMEEGPRRRYSDRHAPNGTNVNFVMARNGIVDMRTYERGVEAETMSCGTGVVAAALSALSRGLTQVPVRVQTSGGVLHVYAKLKEGGDYQDIQLIGPVKEVFRGRMMR